jgi:hypothetical protein
MHPILVAALAEDRHQRSPCGAIAQRPHRQCLEIQDQATAPSQRSQPTARLRKAKLFASVLSLLQNTSKGRRG